MEQEVPLRALIVEDNEHLRAAIGQAIDSRFDEVEQCATVDAARECLNRWRPALLILDVALPDGDAFDVLDVVNSQNPTPAIIAISGHASTEASFALAQLGVSIYIAKPIDLEELEAAVDKALSLPPPIEQQLKACVGHRPVRDVEQQVRRVMVAEALARAEGSRRGAARLLDISRQLLQHIIRGPRSPRRRRRIAGSKSKATLLPGK